MWVQSVSNAYQQTTKFATCRQRVNYNCNQTSPIADFKDLSYFSGFPSRLKSHIFISHDYLSQSKLLLLPRVLAAMCSRSVSKHQKKFCFVSKPNTKWGLVVRGHLAPLYMFIVTSKTNFMFFKQQPVVIYTLTSVLRTSQQWCHWLSWCLCKHFTIWRMNQNLVKTIIGYVALSYQVNLAIEIPNITENYKNSHVFTCRHWYLQCLFKYTSGCWEVYLIGQIFFYLGGLGADRNVSGKLGMKLAISDVISRSNCLTLWWHSWIFFLICRWQILHSFLKNMQNHPMCK